MNQILYTGGKKKGGRANIKKVVKFFAISIIVFGLIVGGIAGFIIWKNGQGSSGNAQNNAIPKISIDRDGDYITITIEHSKNLESATYRWNEEEEIILNVSGQSYIQRRIELPVGTNTLTVTAKDVDAEEVITTRDYVVTSTIPTIDLSKPANTINIIRIKVTDDKELAYITYKWNEDGQETRVDPDPMSLKNLQKDIEVPEGKSKLFVIAVDTDNNTETVSMEVEGVKKPTIEVYADENYLIIKATDEQGMESLNYTLNGKARSIEPETQTFSEIIYRQQLDVGENMLVVEAINLKGAKKYFQGKLNYNP